MPRWLEMFLRAAVVVGWLALVVVIIWTFF